MNIIPSIRIGFANLQRPIALGAVILAVLTVTGCLAPEKR